MRRSGSAAGEEGEETRAVLFISPGCGAASARMLVAGRCLVAADACRRSREAGEGRAKRDVSLLLCLWHAALHAFGVAAGARFFRATAA